MVNKLKYEPHLDKALRFIFGKTLICRNLEIATTISKQSMLDCITIDGDQVTTTLFYLFCKINKRVPLHTYISVHISKKF